MAVRGKQPRILILRIGILKKIAAPHLEVFICIQPEEWQATTYWKGSPIAKSSLGWPRGRMTMGGIYDSAALIHITAVRSVPRSAEFKLSTWFLPYIAMTFDGRPWTAVRPVSTTLNILDDEYLYLSWRGSSKSENCLTAVLLKPLAQAAHAASGLLSERWFLFINDQSQTPPATVLFSLK